MQKVNVDAFYTFGASIRDAIMLPILPLLDEADFSKFPVEHSLEKIYANCLIFLDQTEGYNLPKSRQFAEDIKKLELRYWKLVGEAVEKNDYVERLELFKRFLRQCQRLVNDLESALRHEVSKINAVIVTKKGIYDTDDLIERAEERFPPEVRKYLPDTTIYDLKEAGKCLAFDCPTAMGYHILRATEAVIIKYYESLSGQTWSGSPGWFNYIKELKNLCAPVSITQRLDEMRMYERNPIAHPEFILDIKQALPLFDLASGVIPLMAEEIEKIEKANPPAASP